MEVTYEGDGVTTIAEDYRYSVVTQDNFNYYQLKLSNTGFQFQVVIEQVYGSIEVYLSDSKLPTQDPNIGYDSKPSYNNNNDNGCEYEQCYSFDITYDMYNQVGNYIYLGIFGKDPDSSYRITVTELAFDEDTDVTDVYDGEATSVSVSPDYSFYQIYVGEEDEAMEVTYRSGAGSRAFPDLGADENTWGIDWTEPLTETWIE